MQPLIFCVNTRQNQLDFYLKTQDETLYLFTQKYHRSVFQYFADGVLLDKAFDCSTCYFNEALVHVKSRLPKLVRFLEQENDIAVLRKTRRRLDLPYAA